jgi:hypothetical protein
MIRKLTMHLPWFMIGPLISFPKIVGDEMPLQKVFVGAAGAGLRGEGGGSLLSRTGVLG